MQQERSITVHGCVQLYSAHDLYHSTTETHMNVDQAQRMQAPCEHIGAARRRLSSLWPRAHHQRQSCGERHEHSGHRVVVQVGSTSSGSGGRK